MTRNDDPYLTGQLLIAMPAMEDPRFAQSVILMCAHTNEGAMGIVLNRPLAKPSFEALLEHWTGDGSLRVDENLALTASLDVLQEIARGRGPREGLLALGYASWGPGQLDREIQENVWLSAPAPVDLLFDAEYDTKWRRPLGILHIDPLLLSGAAGHA
jgi:putative transcriptional regulator